MSRMKDIAMSLNESTLEIDADGDVENCHTPADAIIVKYVGALRDMVQRFKSVSVTYRSGALHLERCITIPRDETAMLSAMLDAVNGVDGVDVHFWENDEIDGVEVRKWDIDARVHPDEMFDPHAVMCDAEALANVPPVVKR